jgi:hypothetical protein
VQTGARDRYRMPFPCQLITVAFSPRRWGIASGGLAGGVKVYDCRLCGNLSDLKTLSRERLAPLRR